MPNLPDYKALLHPKCKVCRSPLSSQIDEMLMGKLTHEETDEPYKYDEILDWAGARGLTISAASLSRHRNNHLLVDVLAAIETQRTVQAIAEATGENLGMERAYLQMIVHKSMKSLANMDELDLNAKGVFGGSIRAVNELMKVRREEVRITREQLEEAKSTMRSNGVSEDTLRTLDELLGVKR